MDYKSLAFIENYRGDVTQLCHKSKKIKFIDKRIDYNLL